MDLPFALNISSAQGNVKIWSELRHSQLVAMSGAVQLQQMKVSRQDKEALAVNQLQSRFHWRLG